MPPKPEAEEENGAAADRWSGEELGERLEDLRPVLSAILGAYRIPAQDAEDLVQELLLLFIYKRRRIRRPVPWLRGTLRNLCIRYWQRRRWPSTAVPTDPAALEELGARDDGGQVSAGARLSVSRALEVLRPRERTVVLGVDVLGLRSGEAARRAGYAAESGRQVRRRALHRMREVLRHPERPEED